MAGALQEEKQQRAQRQRRASDAMRQLLPNREGEVPRRAAVATGPRRSVSTQTTQAEEKKKRDEELAAWRKQRQLVAAAQAAGALGAPSTLSVWRAQEMSEQLRTSQREAAVGAEEQAAIQQRLAAQEAARKQVSDLSRRCRHVRASALLSERRRTPSVTSACEQKQSQLSAQFGGAPDLTAEIQKLKMGGQPPEGERCLAPPPALSHSHAGTCARSSRTASGTTAVRGLGHAR
jgi:hypothetical protein